MRNPFFLFGVFGLIGIPCFLLAAYFTFSTVQKLSTWETEEGVIKGYDQSNYPIVTFKYKGKPYEFGSSYKGDDIHDGDSVDVFFPPNEPAKAEINSFFSSWFLPVFLGIFGVTFGGIGVFGIVIQRKKNNAKEELFVQQRGKKLSIPITSVERNQRYTVNGVHPFIVKARWTDPLSNTEYMFISENIWENPGPAVSAKKQVDVYIDESNPNRYYVDVSFWVA